LYGATAVEEDAKTRIVFEITENAKNSLLMSFSWIRKELAEVAHIENDVWSGVSEIN